MTLLSVGWAVALSILGWLGRAGPGVLFALALVALEYDRISGWLSELFLKVRPPSKRRLKRETKRLAQDIRIWQEKHPEADPRVGSLKFHHETLRRVAAAKDEDEKTRIRQERREQDSEEFQAAVAAIRQSFGGRLRHLLQEYERLGVLTRGSGLDTDLTFFEWLLNGGQVSAIAERLEALSHKL